MAVNSLEKVNAFMFSADPVPPIQVYLLQSRFNKITGQIIHETLQSYNNTFAMEFSWANNCANMATDCVHTVFTPDILEATSVSITG
jgi:hypothetical protein